MKKKIILGIVVLVVIVVGLVVVTSDNKNSQTTDTQTIKIGVSAPLTGDLAFLGESFKDGINLAIKDLPKTKYKYEVIFEDDKFSPTIGASTASKLINTDNVDVLLSFGSPVGNVASKAAENSKILHINSIASDPNVAKGDYNFVHWTPPYEESSLMAKELVKKNIKKVVLFEQNQPGVLAVVNSLKKDLPANGINIVDDEKFNGDETDFRTIINKAKTHPADIYFLEATSPSLEILTKQIKDYGIKIPLTGIESFEFTDKPELFEGNWYVNASNPSQTFVDEFTKAYGTNPKVGAGNAYDAINMIVNSIENMNNGNQKPSRQEIRDAFANIQNFKGVMGNLSINSDGIIVSQATLRQIENGKPVTISE